MSRLCFLCFEGAHITLSATWMCLAPWRRLEMKWDTAFRAPGVPHVRALFFRRFPLPVSTLAQQCATSPTYPMGGIQDIREPMRESTGKSAIPNTWARNCKVVLEIAIPTFWGRVSLGGGVGRVGLHNSPSPSSATASPPPGNLSLRPMLWLTRAENLFLRPVLW